MLFVDTPDDPKLVVKAIIHEGIGEFYNKTRKTTYNAPCGTHTKNTEQSHPDQEDILRKIAISQKVTYGPILQWIKSKLRP